jgi:hypothetical protein
MYRIHVKRRGFYPLEESDYQIQQGRELAYFPARRPRKPPAVCE